MCQSCFELSCVGVEGCAFPPGLARGPGLAPGAATEVRDYTALLAYLDYPGTRFNALLPQPGAPVFVSYRFLESDQLPPLDEVAYAVTEVWSFGAAQRDSTRAALAHLAATAGVVFVETTADTAMVNFHGASGSTWAGWANYPSVGDWGVGRGTLVMNRADSFAPGSSSFQVLLHELGHAVGLKHPFDGGRVLAPDLDRTENTLMSYSWSSSNLRVYSPFDVQALQHLYGTPRDLTGWTWAYQGQTFVLAAGPGDDIILGTGSANSLAGGAGADLILGGPLNDTLTGGAGNDTLRGLLGDNLLIGGNGDDLFEGAAWGGRDTIWGGAGHDRVVLRAGNNEVWAGPGNDTLSGGSGSDTLGGGAGDDLIEALEGQRNRLWGGDGQDTLRTAAWGDGAGGGFGNDLVYGGNGWDTLMGGAVNDTLFAGAGSDALYLGAGSDEGYGGAGNDTLFAGPGFDRIWGGAGADRFEFWRDAGWNRIEDFARAEFDRIALGRSLWSATHGPLTARQVVETFGRVAPTGDAVLEFSAGGTAVVLVGAATLAGLSDYIVIL